MSTILYGCESWLNADLKPIIKMYNWCIKELLGVKKTTCTDLCYVEGGFTSLKSLIEYKQHRFFRNIWQQRSTLNDDPLVHAINLVRNSNTSTSRLVRNYITREVVSLDQDRQNLIHNIAQSESSRRLTYKYMNPDFVVHPIYNTRHSTNETHRISFTRFRLSGHTLTCETRRWNRRGRGRLPLEERLCQCGAVQTEQHVVQYCPLSQHLRISYSFTDIPDLFTGRLNQNITCKIIHDILNLYEPS